MDSILGLHTPDCDGLGRCTFGRNSLSWSIGSNDGTQVLVSFFPLCRDFSRAGVESKIHVDYRIAIGQGTCR